MKLLADVGLVGYPNAGKSTLISRISAARPKIADYPFTTLTPNLGVVSLSDNRSFAVADVPGLIEGAHRGLGLGHQFLRHLERTKVLVHLVDMTSETGRDPVADLDTLRTELELYQPALAAKDQTRRRQQDGRRRRRVARRSGSNSAPRSSVCRVFGSPPPPARDFLRCSKRCGSGWPSPTAEVEPPFTEEAPVSDPGLVRRRRGSVRFARVEHASGREAAPTRRSGRHGRRGRSGADSKK